LIEADQVWTTGRTVRCEACGQEWRAFGQGAPPAPPAADVVHPEVQREPAAETEPKPESMPAPPLFLAAPPPRAKVRHGTPGLAWVMGSLIVLAAGAVAAVVFRDQIIQADPELAAVYAALGLETPRVSPRGPHG
jgi:hypothetical protein